MRQTIAWKIPAIVIIGMLLSSNALADYSKSFEGYRIFKTNCFVCHGTDGSGNGPLASKLSVTPADLTSKGKMGQRSDRDLFRIIEGSMAHGQVSNDMPKWRFTLPQTQINSLITYIRYLHTSKYTVSGNPQKGKQVYDDNCTICHGSDGKGKGVVTKFYDMEPADHTNTDSMNKISNVKMYYLISDGTTGAKLMPGWKDTLSVKEIKDVISYIRLLSVK
jgi:mono/diheme cytochrome c family protein